MMGNKKDLPYIGQYTKKEFKELPQLTQYEILMHRLEEYSGNTQLPGILRFFLKIYVRVYAKEIKKIKKTTT